MQAYIAELRGELELADILINQLVDNTQRELSPALIYNYGDKAAIPSTQAA